jgi:glycosyltransferase involved in cell wall biosynthesis
MSLETPLISIVVPFHNAERFIARSIESLLAQHFPPADFEIILVDNNSTDRSVQIAAGYPDVTVLSEPTQGSYAARNRGIRAANGDLIATIDPDCIAEPDWLSSIAKCMEDSRCMVVLGNQRHGSGSTALRLLELYESEKVAYVTQRKQKELYFGYTNNMAFRKCVFGRVGLFPQRIRGGDTIFVRKVVDELGCDAVRYEPAMRTTHLEVDTLGAYYAKRMVYGHSNEKISHQLKFRPLQTSERWAVFRNVARSHGVSIGKALVLLALLAPGALLYESGRRRGMFQRLGF